MPRHARARNMAAKAAECKGKRSARAEPAGLGLDGATRANGTPPSRAKGLSHKATPPIDPRRRRRSPPCPGGMHQMKRTTGLIAAAVAAAGAVAVPALADTADKRIALSNNYAGNSWRQAMLRSWDKVTKPAVDGRHRRRGGCLHHRREPGHRAGRADPEPGAAGLRRHRRSTPPRRTRSTAPSRKRATPASPSSPSTASSPSPAPGASPWTSSRWARTRSLYLADKMPEGGNLLEIRGLAGVFVDDEISRASTRASPRTRSSRSSARSTATGTRTWPRRRSPASCPRCPRHRRGRDAGRRRLRRGAGLRGCRPADTPLIIMGNRQDELHGGRSRRTPTATRPCRSRSRRASRRWPSGWRSRSSTARTCRRTCRAVPAHRPGQPRSQPRQTPRRAASPTSSTRSKTRRRSIAGAKQLTGVRPAPTSWTRGGRSGVHACNDDDRSHRQPRRRREELRRRPRPGRRRPRGRRRRVPRPGRPQRRRQVDADERAGRHAAPRQRHDRVGGDDRPPLRRRAGAQPRHPLRVPGTVALPQPHGGGERPRHPRDAARLRLAAARRRADHATSSTRSSRATACGRATSSATSPSRGGRWSRSPAPSPSPTRRCGW